MINRMEWDSAAKALACDPRTFKVYRSFLGLLRFVHQEDWQGACHAASTILFTLLAAQGIDSDLCLGEVYDGKFYFDHSWVEVGGEIYDAAISNTLVRDFYYPPVFRNIDLSTSKPTILQYGSPSGQGYDQNASWIRSLRVSEYMSLFPNHPQGLFGVAKIIGKYAGVNLNISTIKKHADRAQWQERDSGKQC